MLSKYWKTNKFCHINCKRKSCRLLANNSHSYLHFNRLQNIFLEHLCLSFPNFLFKSLLWCSFIISLLTPPPPPLSILFDPSKSVKHYIELTWTTDITMSACNFNDKRTVECFEEYAIIILIL